MGWCCRRTSGTLMSTYIRNSSDDGKSWKKAQGTSELSRIQFLMLFCLFWGRHKILSVPPLKRWSHLWSQYRPPEKRASKSDGAVGLALGGQLLPTNYVPSDQHKQLLCECKQSPSCSYMCSNTCRVILRPCWKLPLEICAICFCISAGWGSDSAESCWRPCLRPGSPLGPVTKPLCVFWKASRSVRHFHDHSTSLSFIPSSFSHSDLFHHSRLPLGNLSNINIDTNTFEFQVHRNQVSDLHIIQAFTESAECQAITSLPSCPWRRQHVEAVCV